MKIKNGVLKILFVLLVIFAMNIINIQPTYCDVDDSAAAAEREEERRRKNDNSSSNDKGGLSDAFEDMTDTIKGEVQQEIQDAGKGSGEFDPSKYKPQSQTNVSGGDELLTSVNKIVGVVTWIGMILSVTTFVTIGVKYMLGSVEEKADYKKTLVPYLIGAILVFGITTIVEILSTIATKI